MRTGISFSLSPADLDRLRAVVKDRYARQKHVWRLRSCCSAPEGLGTNAIIRETGECHAAGLSATASNRLRGQFAIPALKAGFANLHTQCVDPALRVA
jgi:hypothetical protein